jgi:hypothetical protein
VPMMPDGRRAAGRQFRDTVPRDAHAAWRSHADRTDPLDILRAADATRQPELVPLRYGRMLQSPFTFYRGSAGVMAADLARTYATGIHVQCCGDAHLMNIGGFATPERSLIFDVNDLDETPPAPWEWDVRASLPRLSSPPDPTGFPTTPVVMWRLPARTVIAKRCSSFQKWTCLKPGTTGSTKGRTLQCCRNRRNQCCANESTRQPRTEATNGCFQNLLNRTAGRFASLPRVSRR